MRYWEHVEINAVNWAVLPYFRLLSYESIKYQKKVRSLFKKNYDYLNTPQSELCDFVVGIESVLSEFGDI